MAQNDAGTCKQDWHKSDTSYSGIVPGLSECGDPSARVSLTPQDLRFRMDMATALAQAIADAHPDDAVQLMSAALTDLTHSGRRPGFFLDAEEDAAWWACIEPPEVLLAVLSVVLDNLGNRAMHLNTRKRLFWALWERFAAKDRAQFLAKVRGAE